LPLKSFIAFEREAAAHASRQVADKIVAPVLAIDPAALALFRTVDGERIAQPHVAQRDHLPAEARGHLAHTFDGAGWRKRGNGSIGQNGQRATERSQRDEAGQEAHANSGR
jgi:hypothetical protein